MLKAEHPEPRSEQSSEAEANLGVSVPASSRPELTHEWEGYDLDILDAYLDG